MRQLAASLALVLAATLIPGPATYALLTAFAHHAKATSPHGAAPVGAQMSVLDAATPSPIPAIPRSSPPAASRSRSIPSPSIKRGLPPIMIRIRTCESGDGHGSFNYQAENPSSTASGAWQIVNGTWRANGGRGGHAADASREEQDRVALKLFRAEGTRPWAASQNCWG